MPKILRIINRFNLGGPTYNAAYLSKHLSSNYETMLVGGAKDETEGSSEHIINDLNLEYTIIPEMKRSINPKLDRIAYKKLKKIIADYQPDIVHTHASKAGTLGRIAASACKVPTVVHTFHGHVFHSYFGKTKTTIYKTIERRLAKKSTKIIAISDIQKHELTDIHNICPRNKVEVIPLGFDLDRFDQQTNQKRATFRKEYQLEENEIAIGIIGRLVPIKDHRFFVSVVEEILKKKLSQKVRFFIIGDGEERENIEKYIQERELSYTNQKKNSPKCFITFTSWITNIDLPMAGLDIIVLTSKNEGTPVSLIEAQAAGKPVITSDVGGVSNVVDQGKSGFIIQPNDISGFSNQLSNLIENDTLRKEMSEYGKNFVSDKFSYSRLCEDTEQLYDSLINRNHGYQ